MTGVARKIVQAVATLAFNSAFLLGQPSPAGLYQGPIKQVCSPGLNCYACPYALTACPIGSLQYFIAHGAYHFSIYVAGFLILGGTLFGRLICGWVCPFGLVQELLHRVKSPKIALPRSLRKIRWLSLVILVLLLPYITQEPSFCRFLCPAGTLEGGMPFAIFSPPIRALLGFLFLIKISFLAWFIIGSIFIFRFFCQTACPLGLIYGLFNRVAVWGLRFDPELCLDCGQCERACPVRLKPQRGEYLSSACIRCLKCSSACGTKCLSFGLPGKSKTVAAPESRSPEGGA